MQFSLSVEGIDDVKREFKRLDQKTRALLLGEVTDTVYRMRSDIKADAPRGAEGRLKGSISANVTDLQGEVWTNVDYAPDVERGQKPGRWPKVEDLMAWVKEVINPSKKKLRSVTFLVGRKIFERGTDKNPFFETNAKKWEKLFYKNVLRKIKKL